MSYKWTGEVVQSEPLRGFRLQVVRTAAQQFKRRAGLMGMYFWVDDEN